MKPIPVFLFITLGLLCQGCGVFYNLGRDTVMDVAHVANDAVECTGHYLCRCRAWDMVQAECPSKVYSSDYACGFKRGYADYLYAGGTGDPPPLPPRCYWWVSYETPAGYQAIQDWFHGFRHGAAVARESGQRELVVIPVNRKVPPPSVPLTQLPQLVYPAALRLCSVPSLMYPQPPTRFPRRHRGRLLT